MLWWQFRIKGWNRVTKAVGLDATLTRETNFVTSFVRFKITDRFALQTHKPHGLHPYPLMKEEGSVIAFMLEQGDQGC